MFWNERLGEFAQEVQASVGLPVPMAQLGLRVAAKDGGSSGEAIQRELLLPSKNMALQNALLVTLLERLVVCTSFFFSENPCCQSIISGHTGIFARPCSPLALQHTIFLPTVTDTV